VQIALCGVLLSIAPTWRADSFQFLDRARQARMFLIRKVKLVPANAVSMHSSGPREAKMANGQRFDERARSKMEFGHDVVVVLALGAQLLDAADDSAVVSAYLAPEQQLYAALSLSFRHDGLRESSR
jgi:hypothetical protein